MIFQRTRDAKHAQGVFAYTLSFLFRQKRITEFRLEFNIIKRVKHFLRRIVLKLEFISTLPLNVMIAGRLHEM